MKKYIINYAMNTIQNPWKWYNTDAINEQEAINNLIKDKGENIVLISCGEE